MKRFGWVAVVVTAFALLYPAVVCGAVKDLRKIYEEALLKIAAEHEAKGETISRDYVRSVDVLAQQAQKTGNLEMLLAARAEQKRLSKAKKIPGAARTGVPTVITQLQEKYRAAQDALELDRCRAVVTLTEQYLSHLEREKTRHTMSGAIKDALDAKAESERVREATPYKSAQFAIADSAAAVAPDRQVARVQPVSVPVAPSPAVYSFGWSGSKGGNAVFVKGPHGQDSVSMEHEDGNKVSGSRLTCSGGRSVVAGVSKTLLAACKETNELTIEVGFRPKHKEQSGPARIVSFSLDGYRRNFSLCQEKDRLLLRLRTTETGLNGTSPDVFLTQVDTKKERMDLVITYRPGELRLYVNGRPVDVKQIGGDFSNWEEHQFVLGNEWKDNRPWEGRITNFAISNRFTEKL